MKALIELDMEKTNLTTADRLAAVLGAVAEGFWHRGENELEVGLSATIKDKNEKVIGTIKIVD